MNTSTHKLDPSYEFEAPQFIDFATTSQNDDQWFEKERIVKPRRSVYLNHKASSVMDQSAKENTLNVSVLSSSLLKPMFSTTPQKGPLRVLDINNQQNISTTTTPIKSNSVTPTKQVLTPSALTKTPVIATTPGGSLLYPSLLRTPESPSLTTPKRVTISNSALTQSAVKSTYKPDVPGTPLLYPPLKQPPTTPIYRSSLVPSTPVVPSTTSKAITNSIRSKSIGGLPMTNLENQENVNINIGPALMLSSSQVSRNSTCIPNPFQMDHKPKVVDVVPESKSTTTKKVKKVKKSSAAANPNNTIGLEEKTSPSSRIAHQVQSLVISNNNSNDDDDSKKNNNNNNKQAAGSGNANNDLASALAKVSKKKKKSKKTSSKTKVEQLEVQIQQPIVQPVQPVQPIQPVQQPIQLVQQPIVQPIVQPQSLRKSIQSSQPTQQLVQPQSLQKSMKSKIVEDADSPYKNMVWTTPKGKSNPPVAKVESPESPSSRVISASIPVTPSVSKVITFIPNMPIATTKFNSSQIPATTTTTSILKPAYTPSRHSTTSALFNKSVTFNLSTLDRTFDSDYNHNNYNNNIDNSNQNESEQIQLNFLQSQQSIFQQTQQANPFDISIKKRKETESTVTPLSIPSLFSSQTIYDSFKSAPIQPIFEPTQKLTKSPELIKQFPVTIVNNATVPIQPPVVETTEPESYKKRRLTKVTPFNLNTDRRLGDMKPIVIPQPQIQPLPTPTIPTVTRKTIQPTKTTTVTTTKPTIARPITKPIKTVKPIGASKVSTLLQPTASVTAKSNNAPVLVSKPQPPIIPPTTTTTTTSTKNNTTLPPKNTINHVNKPLTVPHEFRFHTGERLKEHHHDAPFQPPFIINPSIDIEDLKLQQQNQHYHHSVKPKNERIGNIIKSKSTLPSHSIKPTIKKVTTTTVPSNTTTHIPQQQQSKTVIPIQRDQIKKVAKRLTTSTKEFNFTTNTRHTTDELIMKFKKEIGVRK